MSRLKWEKWADLTHINAALHSSGIKTAMDSKPCWQQRLDDWALVSSAETVLYLWNHPSDLVRMRSDLFFPLKLQTGNVNINWYFGWWAHVKVRGRTKTNLKVLPSTMSECTWLDGHDTSTSWIPGCLETKVSAAVGLLVQADPHFTVVFLNVTNHRGEVKMNSFWWQNLVPTPAFIWGLEPVLFS